jgi:hypothetical protein
MSIIIVSGALANKYGNGGGTWERLSWVIGLRRLGFDVYFIEQIAPEACVDATGATTAFTKSVNLDWFRKVTKWFGAADRSALIYAEGEQCVGIPFARLLEMADGAEVLINLSGHLTLAPLLERIACKVYVDVDPGFTQFWHLDASTPFQLAGHDFFFTIGENIGRAECPIPTAGIHWRPIRQPVVLDDWPARQESTDPRFTTIANWRGPFGPVEFDGKTFGLKVHEFRKFVELPQRSEERFEIALNIHPNDQKDLTVLHQCGWNVVDPIEVAGTPEKFRSYVQDAAAEFSVAQGIYVDTHSGWFSDRTVRYLASGKPALVQDTGFGRNLPVGEGLLSFRTMDDAIAGAEAIAASYETHSRAARRIAEQYFDSEKVLSSMLDQIGVIP